MPEKAGIILLNLAMISFALFFFLPLNTPAYHQQNAIREVVIQDTGLHFKVLTDKDLVSEILYDLNLSLNREDRVYPALDQEVTDRIIIERATAVVVIADGDLKNITTFENTVNAALTKAEITLNPQDEISHPLDALLFTGMEIIVTRVEFDTLVTHLPIPFKTLTQKDANLSWGKTQVVQTGQKGLVKKTYKLVYKDGKEAERILESSEIVEEPQDKIILEGTKIVVGESYSGQASFYRYGDKLTCASTRFPKGTPLRVINNQNKKQVIVTVNDYGPFVPGRIIDLNVPAFQEIAPLGAGVINVTIEQIIN